MKRRWISCLGAATLFSSVSARAQTPPDDRGSSGSVLVPPKQDDAPPPAAPVIVPPKLLKDDGASYPDSARAEHLKETFRVVVIINVGVDGKVSKANVETPVGHGFDEVALEAVKTLQFEPATRDGKPIVAKIKHAYEFAPLPSKATGRVLGEKEKPIVGATVTITYASGETASATTDGKGEWSAPVPFGKIGVRVVASGFREASSEESVDPGEELSFVQRLVPDVASTKTTKPEEDDVEDINVRATKPPREVTKRTLEQRELSRIPGTNGDALRALQNLPGVARPPGIAGLLIVRGSGPNDTNVFFDGTLIPLVYHFGGLSSVIPTELLDKIDFYPGNFSTQYGRVMGGAVDVALRDPTKDGYQGLAQVDLIDARALAQGPIVKGSGWTFALAGRRSWVDVWLKPVLEGTGAGVTTAPVYYDYQAIVQKDWGKKAQFRVALIGSDDRLDILVKSPSGTDPGIGGGISAHTGFWRIQGKYKQKLSDTLELRTVLAYGQDFVDFELGSNYFNLTTNPLSSRLELSAKVDTGATLNVGWDVNYTPYQVNVRLPPFGRPGEPPGGPFLSRPPLVANLENQLTRPGLYMEMELTKWKGGRLIPGIRLDYASDTKTWDVSPRVAFRQDVTFGFPRTTLKGGIGIFRQPPQPQETTKEFGQIGLVSNRAIHYSLGVEREFTKNVELSFEGFYKSLDHLVVPGTLNSGVGYVVGAETLLRYKPDSKFFGWIAYTLSRSVRQNDESSVERLAAFDQTHILTVLGSYRLGRGWEFGARFRLVSGNLYSPNNYGFYDENSGVNLAQGTYPPNSARLPIFHQLDLRVDKTWKFGDFKLNAYLDLQNAYNAGNAEGVSYNYNYTQKTFATGLPILPSLGIRGEL